MTKTAGKKYKQTILDEDDTDVDGAINHTDKDSK